MFFRGGIEQEKTKYHLVVIQILAIGPCSRLLSKLSRCAGRQSEQTPKRSRNPQGICQEAANLRQRREVFEKNENK
jgi:hypothetical protein